MSAGPRMIDEAEDPTGEYVAIAPRPPRVTVEVGAVTHPGKVRGNNEDHFLVAKLAKSMRICKTSLPGDGKTRFSDEEGYLLVVADGMGGAAAGEVASKLAVQTVETFVLDVVKWFLHLHHEDAELLGELRKAFERADASVVERAGTDYRLHGMGTTLTIGFSVGVDLFLVHAGDSRAYLFHDGLLRQVTRDHTLVNALVEGGVITAEAARHHSRRNVVTNVIGGPTEGVEAEVHKIEVQDGDILLLCSDGLSGPVEDARIAEILARHPDPETACRRLLDLALQNGAPDNVTAVVARYSVK